MTIFVISNNSFAQNNTLDIDKLCLGNTCTKPIKEFKISNFFFKTRNCETKDYRKCLLWFGNKGNKVKISWVKYFIRNIFTAMYFHNNRAWILNCLYLWS